MALASHFCAGVLRTVGLGSCGRPHLLFLLLPLLGDDHLFLDLEVFGDVLEDALWLFLHHTVGVLGSLVGGMAIRVNITNSHFSTPAEIEDQECDICDEHQHSQHNINSCRSTANVGCV